MPEFMMILCDVEADKAKLSPEEIRDHYARVGAWWNEHEQAGRIVSGVARRLHDELGLNVIGAQAFPPELPGKTRIGLSQNAEKTQPRSNSFSGSAQSGTKRSPMGYGCVLAVFCRGSCGTAFSSMPMSGSPFVRSRM